MAERKRIYLCLAHMSEDGMEQKYVKEAFDTNWVVPAVSSMLLRLLIPTVSQMTTLRRCAWRWIGRRLKQGRCGSRRISSLVIRMPLLTSMAYQKASSR